MKKGDIITWRTINGETSGTIISGDGVNGYLVRLANGKNMVVCPDYQMKLRKRN